MLKVARHQAKHALLAWIAALVSSLYKICNPTESISFYLIPNIVRKTLLLFFRKMLFVNHKEMCLTLLASMGISETDAESCLARYSTCASTTECCYGRKFTV